MSEQYLDANSPKGGAYQKTLVAGTSATLHADMPIQSCIIWTALTDVYLQIGAVAKSSSLSCLIPPNAWTPLPYANLNQINLISAAGGAINVTYRRT